jgi:hypothetical protein
MKPRLVIAVSAVVLGIAGGGTAAYSAWGGSPQPNKPVTSVPVPCDNTLTGGAVLDSCVPVATKP